MNAFSALMPQLGERLGWTLLHSLWQGALIAALLVVTLQFLRQQSAAARHAAAMLSLVAMVGVSGLTFVQLSLPTPLARQDETAGTAAPLAGLFPFIGRGGGRSAMHRRPGAPHFPAGAKTAEVSPLQQNFADAWLDAVSRWSPWIATLWVAGVGLLSARHIGGGRHLHLLRSRGEIPRPALQAVYDTLRRRLDWRRPVRLLESSELIAPMLCGFLEPLILFPARAVTGLSAAEIEAILAHELAHFARKDVWSNLAQIVVETLFFFHPCVWWIGKRAREERELAADDLALRYCTDRRTYAGALLRIAEFETMPDLALAATGGSLMRRVRRIIRPNLEPAGGWGLAIPAALAIAATAVLSQLPADASLAAGKTPDGQVAALRRAFAPTQANQLTGAWVYVGASRDHREPLAGERRKFFGNGQWMTTQTGPSGSAVAAHSGGRYEMAAGVYTEVVVYSNVSPARETIGKARRYTARVEGTILTMTGLDEPVVEVWERPVASPQ